MIAKLYDMLAKQLGIEEPLLYSEMHHVIRKLEDENDSRRAQWHAAILSEAGKKRAQEEQRRRDLLTERDPRVIEAMETMKRKTNPELLVLQDHGDLDEVNKAALKLLLKERAKKAA